MRTDSQPANSTAAMSGDSSTSAIPQQDGTLAQEHPTNSGQQPVPVPPLPSDGAFMPQFEIFEWYAKYQSCQLYFINRAQASSQVQAVAAFVNITLPFQRAECPVLPSPPPIAPGFGPPDQAKTAAAGGIPAEIALPPPNQSVGAVSLIPYIRRLVVTGLDKPDIMHGFFGDDWVAGCGPLHEQERRNYLFAAKAGGWKGLRREYDVPPHDTVPFVRPLQDPSAAEIEAAEKCWSEWLCMEDWVIGPRAPGRTEAAAAAAAAAGGVNGSEASGGDANEQRARQRQQAQP